MLKKEKLSNEILEQALNDAIEKNEELLSYNRELEGALTAAEAKIELFRAENMLMALRIS